MDIEIMMYDELMAEILNDHMAEKSRRARKPDNRSRAERFADWQNEKSRRKECYYRSIEKRICREYQSGKNPLLACNAERKIRNAETVARSDYEIELFNIEDDEQMKADARDYEIKDDVEKLTDQEYWEMVDEDLAEEEDEWLSIRERLNAPPDKWIVSVKVWKGGSSL